MPRGICQCRLFWDFLVSRLCLSTLPRVVCPLTGNCPVTGVRSSLSLLLQQPCLGGGASPRHRERGQEQGRNVLERQQQDEAVDRAEGVKCCLCSRSTGTACASTTPLAPTVTAAPPSTTTGPGPPQRTVIPTSARVRRAPFPLSYS